MPDAQELQPPPRKGVAHLVCGRRSKWVVVVLWLAVMMLAFPLAQKLTDAQDNDASSWLPGSAESTQVLQESEEFRPEVIPAIVVLRTRERPDRGRSKTHRRRHRGHQGAAGARGARR
jgi:putative drug exporter of the RND superfamily